MKCAAPLLLFSVGSFLTALALPPAYRSKEAKEVNFDRDVRPILSEHCFKCHGPDAAQAAAGLRLDSFGGATKMLADGAAVSPGSIARSNLLKRVSSSDPDLQMPPVDSGMKRLTSDQINTLQDWIGTGAKYTKHWSFEPPVLPPLPPVSRPKWVQNPIDRFVLAKLDASHLSPEPEADRNTLGTRAAETLTGLPPSPADMATFRHDTKPGAYERYVDRLLASRAYGENQARFWLDAVRYGDTHGLQLDNERSVYPYRDWVIEAFNQDLGFDKFITWQLAGDLLPNPTTDQMVATGYVRMNLTSDEGGAIEDEFLARNTFDRVDTTSTVLLGLTVGCAKCHDHKYDPIKQADYYGLYAFFNSTQDKPLDDNIALPPPFIDAPDPEQRGQMAVLKTSMLRVSAQVSLVSATQILSEIASNQPIPTNWEISDVYSAKDFSTAFDHSEAPEPGQSGDPHWKPSMFKPGQDNSALIGKDNSSVYVRSTVRLASPRKVVLGVSSDDGVRVWLNGKLIHSNKVYRGLNQGIDQVKADFLGGENQLLVKLVNGGEPDGLNIRFDDGSLKRASEGLAAFKKSPNDSKVQEQVKVESLQIGPATPLATEYRRFEAEEKSLEARVPKTLIAREMATPRITYILKRGLYDQKGAQVERHIPASLGVLPTGAPVNRRGFAEWVTSPSNPLAARVFVNRVWQQYFGVGLVKTADDFGSQGEWPINQPLLDYLAVSFMKNGWSVKRLNRMIVTSAAFRQGSKISPDKLTKDPENRLISRGPRFRLDAEAIRDKALLDGGLLLEKAGGKGFKPYQPDGLWEGSSDPASSTHIYMRDRDTSIYRRSLYMFWKRTSPPPAMVTFDAPLRDTCVVRRSVTDTPLQALTALNETGFLEASRTMAARLLRKPQSDDQRILSAYEIAFQRPPTSREFQILRLALGRYRSRFGKDPAEANKLIHVGDAPADKIGSPPEQASWMVICSSLMNTDEFLTVH